MRNFIAINLMELRPSMKFIKIGCVCCLWEIEYEVFIHRIRNYYLGCSIIKTNSFFSEVSPRAVRESLHENWRCGFQTVPAVWRLTPWFMVDFLIANSLSSNSSHSNRKMTSYKIFTLCRILVDGASELQFASSLYREKKYAATPLKPDS